MHNKFLMIPLLTIMLFLGYFFFKSKSCGASCSAQEINVSAVEFNKQASDDSVVILDVRTKEEFATGHIAKALNLNYNDLPAFRSSISQLDKSKTYLVYCRTGNRSSQAVSLLQASGFNNLINLTGGIEAWQAKSYPLTKD